MSILRSTTFSPLLVEPHVANDLRVSRLTVCSSPSNYGSRDGIVRSRGAADHAPAFDHADLQAALGEIEASDQGIVPGADIQDVARHASAIKPPRDRPHPDKYRIATLRITLGPKNSGGPSGIGVSFHA